MILFHFPLHALKFASEDFSMRVTSPCRRETDVPLYLSDETGDLMTLALAGRFLQVFKKTG